MCLLVKGTHFLVENARLCLLAQIASDFNLSLTASDCTFNIFVYLPNRQIIVSELGEKNKSKIANRLM